MKTTVNHRGRLISAPFVMQQVCYVTIILRIGCVLLYELICIMAQLINYLFIQLRNVQRRHFIMEGFVVTAVERFFEGPIKIPRLLLSSAELPHMAYIWDCLRPCHQTEKLLSLSPNHQNNAVMTSLQNVNVNITGYNVVLKQVV